MTDDSYLPNHAGDVARLCAQLTDLHGALVRIVLEGEGCGPDCSLEFHQWGIASMLRIARDALKRYGLRDRAYQDVSS